MPAKGHRKPKRVIGGPSDHRGFAALVAAFLDWMRVKNYSERTVGNREVYLALLH